MSVTAIELAVEARNAAMRNGSTRIEAAVTNLTGWVVTHERAAQAATVRPAHAAHAAHLHSIVTAAKDNTTVMALLLDDAKDRLAKAANIGEVSGL